MGYNQRFSMHDLFYNPQLKNIFPQFERGGRLQNVYSFAEVERRVTEYLKNALNGSISGEGELTVNGKHKQVLRQVRGLQAVIENFFNSMPSVVVNLRRNTKLYTPFITVEELKDINSPQKKKQAMQVVLDNINYNPDFESERGRQGKPLNFRKQQAAWMKKVGYKE